ncbi:hypothetical protein Cadr_000009860 [Camelus dromedarius]|uniref:Uncharacterized protein n=1 Tax=Camelus dromedarius TaxID=9838 RepID=A0A5N4DWK0_CAMDR|nr:hypothetical protein Cadr_000009860 [Camelus dromedarius]
MLLPAYVVRRRDQNRLWRAEGFICITSYSPILYRMFAAQFCGVLGHTFMEFLKGSGDYCQAQHDLYADK